uniref:Serine/threonine-protein phosphatase with EF-hands n=1 Tax=Latimeria chalumnae TaxID=7897 RepID=H2ZZJ1_LATCH
AIKAAVLIQRWYRQYVARMEVRRRCTWTIFQSIEYAGEQDQIKLYNFFNYLMDHFTPSSSNERNLISHIFSEEENLRDTELVKYCDHESIEAPDCYSGPQLSFPLQPAHAAALVEAFKRRQHLHAHYVFQLLQETRKHLKQLPNINRVSTCYSKEITVCGDLHGKLDDLFLIFYKNGLPSPEQTYVFNGDYVDRGKHSMEILLILFAFLLVYPKNVHLNRGNHEDYIMNLRYGFTKEVMQKYKVCFISLFCFYSSNFFSHLLCLSMHEGRVWGVSLLWKMKRRPVEYKSTTKEMGASYQEKKKSCLELFLACFSLPMLPADILHAPFNACRIESFEPSQAKRFSAFRCLMCTCDMTIMHESYCNMVLKIRNVVQSPKKGGILAYSITRKTTHKSKNKRPGKREILNESSLIWKKVVDILWSDPMHQDGCIPNIVRGGGCYFGPDVTEKVLQKHSLQLLIRSHECKQEGYEFCHNRKVLTIFSASNYYEVGSNRGAYVKLGPDLSPHFVQYQANRTIRKLTMRQRLSGVESSALRALREKLFAHKSDLISIFKHYDKNNLGRISINDWATAVESVLHLGLPWRVLRSQLVYHAPEGLLEYQSWFDDLVIEQPIKEHIQPSLLEALYQNRSNLETIFRIIDSDNSGLISFEEFCQTWKLLSSHLNIEVSDKAICDLARSIDFNKDGNIDINEFLEAFRLVDK